MKVSADDIALDLLELLHTKYPGLSPRNTQLVLGRACSLAYRSALQAREEMDATQPISVADQPPADPDGAKVKRFPLLQGEIVALLRVKPFIAALPAYRHFQKEYGAKFLTFETFTETYYKPAKCRLEID